MALPDSGNNNNNKHVFPTLSLASLVALGPELQPADRDPQGPGEQQEHACAESEPQQY